MNGQIGRPTPSTAPAHCCLASGPTTQHTRAWQELRKVLLGLCKHGTTSPAGRLNALLLPTLRAHPKLVANIVAICYHWVRTEQAVLAAIGGDAGTAVVSARKLGIEYTLRGGTAI